MATYLEMYRSTDGQNYAGCFAATLSSSLASYVSCPKLLQVIADDNLYPYWMVGVLGKGYGQGKEPYRAYAFTFVLALTFVLIGILLLLLHITTTARHHYSPACQISIAMTSKPKKYDQIIFKKSKKVFKKILLFSI